MNFEITLPSQFVPQKGCSEKLVENLRTITELPKPKTLIVDHVGGDVGWGGGDEQIRSERSC